MDNQKKELAFMLGHFDCVLDWFQARRSLKNKKFKEDRQSELGVALPGLPVLRAVSLDNRKGSNILNLILNFLGYHHSFSLWKFRIFSF